MLKAIINFTVEVDYSKLIDSEEGLNVLKKFLNVSDEKFVAKAYMDNLAKTIVEEHLKAEHINYNVSGDIVEVPEGVEEDVDLPYTEEAQTPANEPNYIFNSDELKFSADNITSLLLEYIAKMEEKYGKPQKIYISESNYKVLEGEVVLQCQEGDFNKVKLPLTHIIGVAIEVVDDGMFNYAMDFKRHGKEEIDTHYIY